jgi:Family of unknown function (DUF6364)
MDTKLTLKLNQEIIEKAKKYASNKKLSLSKLVENYLNSIVIKNENKIKISPFVQSMTTGKSLPNDLDIKNHKDSLLDKYK